MRRLGPRSAPGRRRRTWASRSGSSKRLGLIAGRRRLHQAAGGGRRRHAPVASYDHRPQRLLVPDFVPLDSQRILLATRSRTRSPISASASGSSLQLTPDAAARPLDGDAQRARLALVEGDATLTALELADPQRRVPAPRGARRRWPSACAPPPARDAPAWLAGSRRFAHVDGLLFVARVRARTALERRRRALGDPPASTEQVLHPERYDACEEPLAVDDGSSRAAGFDRPRRATCWASWWCGPGWPRSCRPRSPSAPPPAGAGDRAAPLRRQPDGGARAERARAGDGLAPPGVAATDRSPG